MKIKWLAIIMALVIIVGAGVTAGVIIYNNMPENVLLNSVTGMINDFSKRDEIKPLSDMLSQGSLEIQTEEMARETDIPITGHVFSGKLYFSEASKYMVKDLKYKNRVSGGEFLGELYFSDDFCYVREEGYLKKAYGIKLDSFSKELKQSIFAYGSGSKYAIEDKIQYQRLLDCYDNQNNERMLRDIEKIAEKYAHKGWQIFCDNATFTSEDKELTLDGKTDTYRVILIRVKKDDINKMMADFYEFIKEDESIPDFLDEYEKQFCRLVEDMYGIDSLKQEYENFLREYGKLVDSIESDSEDSNALEMFTIQIVTPKMSSTLLQLSLSLVGENFDGGNLLTIDCGSKGIAKSNSISISSEAIGVELKYEVTKAKNRWTSQMQISSLPDKEGNNDEITSIRLFKVDLNKKAKAFSLVFGPDEDFVEIKGEYEKKLRTITLNINSISREVEVSPHKPPKTTNVETEIKVVLRRRDRMPLAPWKYRKISEITEREMDMIDDFMMGFGFD